MPNSSERFVAGEPAERGVHVHHQAIAAGFADDHAVGRDIERAAQEFALEAVHALPAVRLSVGGAAERASSSWLRAPGVAGKQLVAFGRGPAAHAHQAQVRSGLDFELEFIEQLGDRRAVVAHRQHVAAGVERRFGARHDVAELGGATHRQIVGEHRALEAQLFAQRVLDPAAREARGRRIDGGKQDVRDHDAGQCRWR